MSLHLSFLLTYAPSVFAPRWPQVGVHIADVTHFVRPGTALDEEAAKRGTTVYLADRRHVWLSLLAHLFCVVFGVGLCIVEQQLTSSPPHPPGLPLCHTTIRPMHACRIDMVPGLLSSNLCSLRGGEERFAFSCIWEMTEAVSWPCSRLARTRANKQIHSTTCTRANKRVRGLVLVTREKTHLRG